MIGLCIVYVFSGLFIALMVLAAVAVLLLLVGIVGALFS